MPKFTPQSIPDVVLVEPDVHGDERGFFLETWQVERYRDAGIDAAFVQDNHSSSGFGILRGLHAQLTRPQGKLVRCIEGEVYDVAVDIRPASPTFGRWSAATLSAANFQQLWVPPGFAHGFCVRSERAQFEYKCTDFYAPDDEITLAWDDPALAIPWPLADPLLSEKDQRGLSLEEVRARVEAAAG
ncbi:MAG: dTDP-4-dehydrorhamnose 3,5-epimerase [Myxococcales bacterium]|nr:dTDP-4-dehydrorhamnose 3,5-epimerase [Myxococcales bacterium]